MKKCVRPANQCEFQQLDEYKQAKCNIRGKDDYKCLEEEAYMSDVIDVKEKKKVRGEKEIAKFNAMVKELSDYMDYCPDPTALDRVNDACGHLRKARLALMTHYGIDLP